MASSGPETVAENPQRPAGRNHTGSYGPPSVAGSAAFDPCRSAKVANMHDDVLVIVPALVLTEGNRDLVTLVRAILFPHDVDVVLLGSANALERPRHQVGPVHLMTSAARRLLTLMTPLESPVVAVLFVDGPGAVLGHFYGVVLRPVPGGANLLRVTT